VKFLLDMNLSPKWVDLLRAADYEALRWTALGEASASDQEIMHYALIEGYTVLTHDQDFNTLLAHSRAGKPSVVLLRLSSLRVDKVGLRVLKAIAASKYDLARGAIVVIEDKRVRIRPLPLFAQE
jgi:predicted nuclease of predicted toxin-antitoxin system